jgi:hypothetical protein
MAFLLGEELERTLARSDSHNTPVHTSVAKEFPDYAGAMNRLDTTRAYALKTLPLEADQQAFIARARARIAEYIEHGQQYRPMKDREPPTR